MERMAWAEEGCDSLTNERVKVRIASALISANTKGVGNVKYKMEKLEINKLTKLCTQSRLMGPFYNDQLIQPYKQ
jgi:hypothetical protein